MYATCMRPIRFVLGSRFVRGCPLQGRYIPESRGTHLASHLVLRLVYFPPFFGPCLRLPGDSVALTARRLEPHMQ